MSANSLPSVGQVSGAIEVLPYGQYRDTMNAANRAVSNAVDFSVSTGVLMTFVVVLVAIIMLLLAERRAQSKAHSIREAARDKAADERYRIDAARQERDIASRDNLAEALQEQTVLIRTWLCTPPTPHKPTPKLLPSPDGEPS